LRVLHTLCLQQGDADAIPMPPATQIHWTSSDEPWKGLDYLYLSNEDHLAFCARHGSPIDRDDVSHASVGGLPYVATRVDGGGSSPPHWRLHDVIGSEAGLGVECLSGSAAIAAAFARAFEKTFTLTLVSGRTVGIGAYLARLGRRYAPCHACSAPAAA
jgi:acetyl-CoA carboxylase / biotin carboxylase 1